MLITEFITQKIREEKTTSFSFEINCLIAFFLKLYWDTYDYSKWHVTWFTALNLFRLINMCIYKFNKIMFIYFWYFQLKINSRSII